MRQTLERLLGISPTTPARAVAMMIADVMLESGPVPYNFSINHDVRPPKNLACPLRYDWYKKDRVGVKTTDRERVRKWLTVAVIRGYTVRREHDELTSSLEIAHRRAVNHQRPPREDNDDDIPF